MGIDKYDPRRRKVEVMARLQGWRLEKRDHDTLRLRGETTEQDVRWTFWSYREVEFYLLSDPNERNTDEWPGKYLQFSIDGYSYRPPTARDFPHHDYRL